MINAASISNLCMSAIAAEGNMHFRIGEVAKDILASRFNLHEVEADCIDGQDVRKAKDAIRGRSKGKVVTTTLSVRREGSRWRRCLSRLSPSHAGSSILG